MIISLRLMAYNTGIHRTGIQKWFSKNIYLALGRYAAGDFYRWA